MNALRSFASLCLLALLASVTYGAESPSTVKEYTFELVTLQLGDKMRKGRASNARIQIDIPSAMTDDDLESLRSILDQLGATQPDSEGYREFSMSNGTRLRIGGLIEDPDVAGAGVRSLPIEFSVINDFSATEAALVLRIATAANLFVGIPEDPARVATTYQVTDRHFRRDHPHASFTPDAEALAEWVRKNIPSRDVLHTNQ